MIHFKLDGTIKETLTWDDLEILEGGKIGAAKNVLARFVVDESGNPVDFETAKKILGKLPISQIEKVMGDFMNVMTGTALPPPTAAS